MSIPLLHVIVFASIALVAIITNLDSKKSPFINPTPFSVQVWVLQAHSIALSCVRPLMAWWWKSTSSVGEAVQDSTAVFTISDLRAWSRLEMKDFASDLPFVRVGGKRGCEPRHLTAGHRHGGLCGERLD